MLGLWLVPDGAIRFALYHAAGVERKPCPRDSTRVGTNVSFLLELLARADFGYAFISVDIRSAVVAYLASEWITNREDWISHIAV